MAYFFLATAIVAEVIATSFLKATDGFQRLWPSLIVLVGYGISFWLLSLTLRTMAVGVVYAIWSGAGIVLVSIAAYFLYRQTLDAAALIGIGLIVAGVLVLNLFSSSVSH
jgi:small multidrug resistance pump